MICLITTINGAVRATLTGSGSLYFCPQFDICQKVYKSALGLQYHLNHYDHENVESEIKRKPTKFNLSNLPPWRKVVPFGDSYYREKKSIDRTERDNILRDLVIPIRYPDQEGWDSPDLQVAQQP